MKASKLLVVILACACVVACSQRVIKGEDGAPPVYRMSDGSQCGLPSGYPEVLQTNGTRQVRALFLSSAAPEDVAAGVVILPSHAELDAALYLSCGEYARKEISRELLASQRQIYQALRLQHLTRGIRNWRDNPQGFDTSGKLCHFIFDGNNPDARNVTRLVPQATSADDCAIHANRNEGTHVLLGCSAGQWKTHWARQRILVGVNGWANRRRSLAGTRFVPEPDCGWG